ncbi:RHS repeat-associated core domain-containing protein [Snodgrassella alvi]|uniref:RHS repeat-associated core domain-containing protein n=1 Tax=Snodgrassella alvi TaxID=1196083 RepID=UPI00351C6800
MRGSIQTEKTVRYYDPDTDSFTKYDPIGLASGFNLYQYAPNALIWIDHEGLRPSCRQTY